MLFTLDKMGYTCIQTHAFKVKIALHLAKACYLLVFLSVTSTCCDVCPGLLKTNKKCGCFVLVFGLPLRVTVLDVAIILGICCPRVD